MKLEPGKVIAGRYAVAEQIGMGGMAVVYRALDTKLNRPVTLKVMREELMEDQDYIARFKTEAHAAACLSNACIVNVYDVGQEDSMHYIVMEYVEGITLKELIKQKAPLSNKELAAIAEQIAQALSAAHKKGIVHRDIKPQNILVTPQGLVKVTDFGIARAVGGGTITSETETIGSVHYFSPEQARGGYVDQRSDIYSLGIVMFEMATGKLPFNGTENVEVALKHLNEPLPSVTELNHSISEKLDRIIKKAASKSTASRYGSADELLAELRDDPKRKKAAPKTREKLDSKDDRKIVVAAIFTALFIIALLTGLGWYIIDRNKPVYVSPPYVVGLQSSEAAQLVVEAGLVWRPENVYDDTIAEGVVISQDEPPEGTVEEGTALHALVSLGSNLMEIPDVVNKSQEEAYAVFEQMGIGVTGDTEHSDTVPAGKVIRQDPPAGNKMSPETIINLFISIGPTIKTVTVPNIVGMTEPEAIEAIQSKGMILGTSTKSPHDTVEVGIIISQSRKEGTEVQEGSELNYTISTGPAKGPTPTPTTPIKFKLLKIEYPLSEDMETVHLKVNKIIAGGAENVLDEVIPAEDFPYSVRISGTGVVEYQVYYVGEDGQLYLIIVESIDFDKPD
ncbi:MAG: protein kinase [Clostridiales bacterium]|jgi:serine/threonine-protein kinase|nr:protein kinase [Clostridiales bacterium]MDR2752663.1 protein kinase [Clostridiales bacterium]